MSPSLSRTNSDTSRTRTLRDKTSYTIIPTPPSPTYSSPSLTQSTSNSNSSSSPPQPSTPPRSSRSRTRYPELGRVPLHRRGTSKTYERLEDLLREAGYKETRVFTPEGEHAESDAEDHNDRLNGAQRRSVRGGVDAVVGFLAGLMPGAVANRSPLVNVNVEQSHATQHASSSQSPLRTYSPPASPLAHRHPYAQNQRIPSSSRPSTPTPLTSRESLEPTPKAKRKPTSRSHLQVSNLTHSLSNSSHQHRSPPHHQALHSMSGNLIPSHSSQHSHLHSQPSRSSLRQQHHISHMQTATSSIAHPRPSRAGAYLRHMASAPSIPKRPNSTPVRHPPRITLLLNDSEAEDLGSIVSGRGNGEGEEEYMQPPLPRTWLETVARAVLFGGAGSYLGGPSSSTAHLPRAVSRMEAPALRHTRSSISQVSNTKYLRPNSLRSGLSDRASTMKMAPSMLAPPELFGRIERGRARMSTGEVNRMRVMCRSAPVSRAGSKVRGGGEDKKERRGREGKERGRGRGRREEKWIVPSLAQTSAEGDEWVQGRRTTAANVPSKKHVTAGNRYLSGWGVESESEGEERATLSSEEEEGELDLARILVPPKRQNSIKSLRKHLAPSINLGADLRSRSSPGKPSGAKVPRRADEAGGRDGATRRLGRVDDGDEGEDWGRGWVRKGDRTGASGEDNEDEDYIHFLRGSATKQSRRGGTRK